MKLFPYPAVLVALLGLSACASETNTTPAPAAAPKLVKQDAPGITGSRIPARRTEKMVGATTGKDYEENLNSKRQPLIVN
jgi:hypothetical protein